MGWGHHLSSKHLVKQSQHPLPLCSASSQCCRWRDGDLHPYQFAIRFFSVAPLSSTLFYFPVMVSDGEQAGQHLGLREPILAVPFPAVSVGFGAGASSHVPAGSRLAASQSEDSSEQLSGLMGYLSVKPHVPRKGKCHHRLRSNLG